MRASVDARRGLVEPNLPYPSIVRQCELPGLNRPTCYLAPAENLRLMRPIDEQYIKTPFLRPSADDGGSGAGRRIGQSQAGPAFDAADGSGRALSNPLDGEFCLEAMDEALSRGKPEIFNTDQGSPFTSREYTGRLEGCRGRGEPGRSGRALDNVFVERL